MGFVVAAVVFFVFLALIFLYWFGVKIALARIAKQLKLEMTLENCKGLSIGQLKLKNSVLEIDVKNFGLSVNLWSMIFRRVGAVVALEVDSMKVTVGDGIKEFYPKNAENEKKESAKSSWMVFGAKVAAFLMLRECSVTIRDLELNINELCVRTRFRVEVHHRPESSLVAVRFGTSQIGRMKDGHCLFAFDGCHFSCSIIPDFDFAIAALAGWPMKKGVFSSIGFTITSNGRTVELLACAGKVLLPCGRAIVSLNISLKSDLKLPVGSVTSRPLRVDWELPNAGIRSDIKTDQLRFSCEDLRISLVSETITREFLSVTDVRFILPEITNPNVFDLVIGGIHLDYATIDGLNMFGLVKQLRGKPTGTPSRPVLAFPQGRALIKAFDAKLTLTDSAIIELSVDGNVTLADKMLTVPEANILICGSPVGNVKTATISSPDKEWLQVDVQKACICHDQTLEINTLIDNILFGWKIIKPLVSKGILDTETLPLPIHLLIHSVGVRILEKTSLNARLARIAAVVPKFLKEKLVLEHILKKKMEDLPLTEAQQSQAHEELGKLLTDKYRARLSQTKSYQRKGKYFVVVREVNVKLDSRGVVNKVETIRSLSPATPPQCEKLGWETLEGLKLDLDIGEVKLSVMDIKESLLEVQNITGSALIIVGEAADGHVIYRQASVCGRMYDVPVTFTPCKLYCDVKVDVQMVKACLGAPHLRLFDDLGDIIAGIIPVSVDPSPEMMWWDKLRSLLWGHYEFCVHEIEACVFGGTNYHKSRDNMVIGIRDVNAVIDESVWTTHIDGVNVRRLHDGPKLMHIPDINVKVALEWETPCGDQRRHIFFRDFDRKDDPQYDTYEQFRATGLRAAVRLSLGNGEDIPIAEADFAHIRWTLAPILDLINLPIILRSSNKKMVQKVARVAPKIAKLSDLRIQWNITFDNTPAIFTRLFDRFRDTESETVSCSVDITFMKPVMYMALEMFDNQVIRKDITLTIDTITMSARDISFYCKYITADATTFFTLTNMKLHVDTSSALTIGAIKLYANQFYGVYLWDFAKSLRAVFKRAKQTPNSHSPEPKQEEPKEIQPPVPRPKGRTLLQSLMARTESKKVISQEQGVKNSRMRAESNPDPHLASFTTRVVDVKVTLIEFVYESVAVDATMYLGVTELQISVLQDADQKMAVTTAFSTLDLAPNVGFGPTPSLSCQLLQVRNMKIDHWEANGKNLAIKRRTGPELFSIWFKCKPGALALISQFKDELMNEINQKKKKQQTPEEEPTSAREKMVKLSISCDIDDLQMTISSPSPKAVIWAGQTHLAVSLLDDNSKQINISVGNAVIKDLRISGEETIVFSRAETISSDIPVILLDMCDTGKVINNLPVYRFEVTTQPLLLFVDNLFFAYIVDFFLQDKVTAPPFDRIKFGLPNAPFAVPSVQYISHNVLPSFDDNYRKKSFRVQEKMDRVKVGTVDTKVTQLYFGLFRIAGCSITLTASFPKLGWNACNRCPIVLHDILFENLQASKNKFIFLLIAAVKDDVLRQLFKHVLSLGKPPKEIEHLQTMLKESEDEALRLKRELLFGDTN